MLTIVATPIGNLKDITFRAIETLQSVDGIICEDSRRTSILLNHYQIKKPMLVLNDFNETKTFPVILQKLLSGENLALVSDAGTPLISDPGYKLVRACLENQIAVDSLPGASAPIVALTLSGLPPDKFFFLGYLPEKSQARLNLLTKLKELNKEVSTTFIMFVSPYKLIKTLGDFQDVFGNIQISLATELTKLHQVVKTQSVEDWLKEFQVRSVKGEYTLLMNMSTLQKM